MADTDDPTLDDDVAASAPLGRLRQKVRQTRERAHVDLTIDVADDVSVVARYRILEPEELAKVNQRPNQSDKASHEKDCAILVRACVGLWFDRDGELLSLDGLYGEASARVDSESGKLIGEPVTFASQWLADELEVTTSVAAVQELFAFGLQIPYHVKELIKFSQGSAAQQQRDALGN